MEILNLNEMSVEETRELIKNDPQSYIAAFFEEAGIDHSDLDYGLGRVGVNGFGMEVVYSEGGCEGGGEHVERVVAIKYGNEKLAFFRVYGFYQSYNGTEWNDERTIVYPREVVVTQYFDTKE